MISIEGNRETLYQWDLNQRVILTNIKEGTEVHFSNSSDTQECCPIVEAYKEGKYIYANIPNIFLQSSGIVYVYIYIKNEDKSYTNHYAEILVLARPKPADYVYTETEVKCWDSLVKQVDDAVKYANNTIDEIIRQRDAGEFKGDPGESYILTDNDKEEIVESVLDALPRAEDNYY